MTPKAPPKAPQDAHFDATFDDNSAESGGSESAAISSVPGGLDAESDPGWYDDATATFGDRVAAAREAAGLSVNDLARRAGVSVTSVRAWEEDQSEPRANTLQRVAGILGVSIMWLLAGEGDGLDQPLEMQQLPEDLTGILVELRSLRTDQARLVERLGRLEKRLRLSLAHDGPGQMAEKDQ
ncbi:MAG: helix-turn-helix domain-containing protein [Pseudomonadota bacterium]